jgi:hypothetical protein
MISGKKNEYIYDYYKFKIIKKILSNLIAASNSTNDR